MAFFTIYKPYRPLPQSLQEAEQYDASIPNPIGRNDGPPIAGQTPSRAPIGRTAAYTSDGKRAFLKLNEV